MANRLTESGKHRVTLIEAGGSDRRFVELPLGYGKLFYDPSVNWMYQTEPDPGLNGQRDHWPRGSLGGSSLINAMVWIRGHRADYEEWGADNPGWGWEDCLAGYKAIEDFEAGRCVSWQGRAAVYLGEPQGAALAGGGLHQGLWAAGLPYNPDFNGASQEGAGTYQMTIKNARRNSTARAFLRPAMKRGNLRVITGAQVTRVIFDGKRAVGVQYRQGGQVQQLGAATAK